MSRRIEELLKSYPEMVQKRNCLAYQLAHFKGLSAEEVIESMYTPRQDGERVQTSALSDKTAQIAMVYRERQERMNREWYGYLEAQLKALNDELVFLEAALASLSGILPEFMRDLVIDHMTWDALERKYHISRFTVSTYRKKAISELEARYAERDQEMMAFLLK